ncbi:sensor histidine kinase [Glycomyces rhizosphaerae]|uniref:Sensor histidine kinase n=1 Tax=Glycomyces rhizosphaerae TaxID=2054422 RepID=A0ABV7Q1B0_9ACTN
MPHEDEPSARNLRRLRQFTFFSLIGCGPLALLASALYLAGSDLVGVALPLVAGAATGSVVLCTAALALHWHGQGPWRRRILWSLSLLLVVLGAIAEARAGQMGGAWGGPIALLVTEAALWARPGRRARALVWGTLATLAVVVVLAQTGLMAPEGVFTTLLMVPSLAGGILGQLWHYEVARELERARELAAELAVAEERLRFAGELHDVQGGNLQAITLKAQVARRLVAVDPERAEAEMRAVEELARTALKDTREVVGGYRKVALVDEIDSAARILKSAGVQATVPDAAPSLDADTEKLLGMLVREATTNLIRHAEPTAADLSIVEIDAEVTVTITNNGAPSPAGSGNGLAMLAERFTEAGGTVEHVHDGDRFTLKGTVPKPRAEQVPPQAKRSAKQPKRAGAQAKRAGVRAKRLGTQPNRVDGEAQQAPPVRKAPGTRVR